MEKIKHVFNSIFLIVIYAFFGALFGLVVGKIVIYFVDINMFRWLIPTIVCSVIGIVIVSMNNITNNYLYLIGIVIGGAVGFIFHHILNNMILAIIYNLNIDSYINLAKPSYYGAVYGATIGALCGILIYIFILIEILIKAIKKNKVYYGIDEIDKNDKIDKITPVETKTQDEAKVHTKLPKSNSKPNVKSKTYDESNSLLDPIDVILNTPSGISLALAAKVATKYHRILDDGYKQQILDIFNNNSDNVLDKQIDNIYQDIINSQKDDFSNINLLCMKFKKLNKIDNNPKNKESFMRILLGIAFLDGNHIYEDDIVFQIALHINMDMEVYFTLKREFNNKISTNIITQDENNDNNHLNILYDILEVLPGDDNQMIKKSYRRLAAKYHPDKYTSKELPEDVVRFAEERFKDINYAYDILKKYHNII